MSTQRVKSPLNDTHCACLDKVLQRSAEGLQLCADCKDAGLPVEDVENMLRDQQKQAQMLKAKFFADRS